MMAFENFLRNVPQQTLASDRQRLRRRHDHRQSRRRRGQTQRRGQRSGGGEAQAKAKPVRTGPKVGRNDPCPCGSGKKYKHCCGK